MVRSKFKLKKVVSLWLQVFFYSFISYLIVVSIGLEKFKIENFILTILPVISKRYWFFTAYILLYLLSYFLNKMLLQSSKKALKILLLSGFLITFFMGEGIGSIVNFDAGYNLIWFIYLYIFGAYLKLYPPKIKKLYIFLIYMASTLIMWGGFFIPETNLAFKVLNMICFSSYTAPFCLIASVSIFMLCKGSNCKNLKFNKFITFISSCTFGIYLLQESSLKPYIYHSLFVVSKYWASPFSPLYVLGFALALFALGLASEFIRKPIFHAVKLLFVKLNSQPFILKLKARKKRKDKNDVDI